ncbi:hypothetical protein [Sinorhizobium meliloti]|uniref:hypothetical protein n=1 Tax=Rhizobium meliloti TaxID=382 RepID=UPI00035CD329|nr:hypothetical protein [Sinorhizobium meliloti]
MAAAAATVSLRPRDIIWCLHSVFAMQNITIFINAGWNVTGRASHALCKHVIDRMLVFHFIFKLLKRMPEIASRRPTGIINLINCLKESIAH